MNRSNRNRSNRQAPSRVSRSVAATPGIDRATFRRLADAYRQRWPVGVCVVDVEGQRRYARGWWPGRDSAAQRDLLAFNVQEGLRFGEPTISYGPDQRLYWATPLMHNARVLGGLIGGIEEEALFPEGEDQPPIDLRQACAELRHLTERENLTNAALLAAHRAEQYRERQRAEALHSLKSDTLGSVRQLYLREEPQLLAAVRRADRSEARLILNRMLTVILYYANDRFDLIKSFFMELVATICRTAVEAGADSEAMLGHNFQNMTELGAIRSLEQLSPWLHEMLERTMSAIQTHRSTTGSLVIAGALAYMQQHLHEPISRDDVAAAVALSPSHFSRQFKRHVGQGFNRMLVRMRIDHAAELLARTDRPVSEVARASGFREQSYFARRFQQIMGRTPRAYRLAYG